MLLNRQQNLIVKIKKVLSTGKIILPILFALFLILQIPSSVFAASTLTTGITSFWKLEEASGTRVDDLGANNLGVSGSVSSATGKIGNAASFNTSSYLTINDNASLKTGSTDFSVSAWVYLNSLTGVQSIVSKSGAPGSDVSLCEYALFYYNNTFYFSTYGTGAPAAGYAATSGSPSINTWYHLVGVHNYATNTNYLYVNAGTPASIASVEHAGTIASFQIGAFGGGYPFNGRIDALGFWRKALTSSEVTELYNSSSGIEYPFSSVSTDATISAGTLASQALAGTFTGGANIAASSALTVTVPDASKTNAALALTKGNANSVVKYVKSSQPADDTAYTSTYTSGSTTITVANNDIIWLLVTAEDTTTKLYYKITVTVSPGTITITTPVAYQVFQRNSSNQANIAITGTYSGTPTSIEASWNGGAYTTIVASPTGGTFSGTLSNQSAGQGTLTVRYTNDNSVSATKSYVGIGDVFVIAGQSNASGKGFNNQTYSHATLKAGMFGNDDNWKELADPVDIDTNQVDAVSDDATIPGVYPRGTIWPGIATLFMADQNVPVAFIPTSLSATAISAWQPNASNHGDTTTLYGSMYRRINAAGGAKAVLFWQGESDALAGVSQSSYKTQLDAFANAVYSDFGIKVSAAVIGDFSSLTGTYLDNIRLAEQQAWNDGSNVLIGPELYNVNLSDESGDGLHFRSDADIQTAANRWWSALKQALYSGTTGRGPIISTAEYNSAKTQITLTFTSNSLPLLPASGFSGIAVKDNGVAATISTITKTATNKLLITLSSAASGTITVSLGQGRTGIGATIPTDSSTYNLPAEIFVDHATTQLDETAPTTTASPLGGYYNATQNVTLSCADNIGGTGCDKIYYTTNGDVPTTGSTQYTTTPISITSTTVLKFFSADLTGNSEAYQTQTYTFDTTGPTGTISNGNGTPTNSTTPTFNLTIADTGVGITGASMRFSCNNSTWSSWESYATPKIDFNVRTGAGCTDADGSKTVYVEYKDSLGNVGSSYNTGAFTLDTTASFATLSGTPASITNSTSASITVAGTDIVAYKYKLDSGSYGSEIAVATLITLSSLSDASHTLSVIGKDSTGNWQIQGSATTYTWTVDTTAPVITRIGPASVTISQGQAYTDGGATALDNVDGNITADIVTVNPVNINVAGTYIITYNVSDAALNPAVEVTRTVTVTGPSIISSGSSLRWWCASNLYSPNCRPTQITPAPTIIPTTTTSITATTPTQTMQKYTFTKTLKYGMTNIEVKYLQTVLNQDPATQVATIGNGSPSKETIYFRKLTLSAVKRFQTKYKLAVDGIVGKFTRGKLMEVER